MNRRTTDIAAPHRAKLDDIHQHLRFFGRLDIWHDDSQRAAFQRPRRKPVLLRRHAYQGRDAGIEGGGRDLGAGFNTERTVLEIDK